MKHHFKKNYIQIIHYHINFYIPFPHRLQEFLLAKFTLAHLKY